MCCPRSYAVCMRNHSAHPGLAPITARTCFRSFPTLRKSCSRTRSSKLPPSQNGLSSVRTKSLAPSFGYRKIATRDSIVESNDSDRRTPRRSLQRRNDLAVTLGNEANSLWQRKAPTETTLAGWGGRIRTPKSQRRARTVWARPIKVGGSGGADIPRRKDWTAAPNGASVYRTDKGRWPSLDPPRWLCRHCGASVVTALLPSQPKGSKHVAQQNVQEHQTCSWQYPRQKPPKACKALIVFFEP